MKSMKSNLLRYSLSFYILIFLILSIITLTNKVIKAREVPIITKGCQDVNQVYKQVTVKINAGNGNDSGTGVIIAKKGNIYTVLTAAHVIETSNQELSNDTRVITYMGHDYKANKVESFRKISENFDLGLLQFKSETAYSQAIIGNSDQVTEKMEIYVSGYPSALDIKYQKPDILTAKISSRQDNIPNGYDLRYAPPGSSGMSGGAVFDACGRVIGIHGRSDSVGKFKDKNDEEKDIKDSFSLIISINKFVKLLPQFGLTKNELLFDRSPLTNPSGKNSDAFAQGIVSLDSKNYLKAIKDFSEAIKTKNNNIHWAYFYRAISHSIIGNKSNAIDDYTQAIKFNPKLARYYYNRGLIYARYFKKYQDGLSDFDQAIKINPKFGDAYAERGNCYLSLGDIQKAIEDYTNAIKIMPHSAEAYYNRGIAYDKKEQPELALRDFKQAKELSKGQNDDNYQEALKRIREIQGSN